MYNLALKISEMYNGKFLYFCSVLELITRPSETKTKKRKRKVVVVKKASGGASDIEMSDSIQKKGAKVFVKRVKKFRDPRKAPVINQDTNKFPTASFFDEIRKQLVFKSSGYVFVLILFVSFIDILRNNTNH